jgi:hypothetical protein
MLTTMELYLSKHKIQEYDNLFMQNMILKTKQKFMEISTLKIELVEFGTRSYV